MKDIFGSIAAGALALTPVAAFSQDALANQNVAATSFEQSTVQYVDAQSETINDAQILAAAASRDKVAIVVWGGNQIIQQEAYNAALDLVDMGIPTAFVHAPDRNGLNGDATFQIYAASKPTGNDGNYGTDYAHLIRADMREAGMAAYREAFPRELAVLSIQ